MNDSVALAVIPPPTGGLPVRLAREQVALARAKVAERLESLQQSFARATDWRLVVRRHPVAVTVGVLVAAALLGRWLLRRPAPVRPRD